MRIFPCTLTDTDHLAVATVDGAVLLTIRENRPGGTPTEIAEAAEHTLSPEDAGEVAALLGEVVDGDESDESVYVAAGVRVSRLVEDPGYLVTIDNGSIEFSVGLSEEDMQSLADELETLAADAYASVELADGDELVVDTSVEAMQSRGMAMAIVVGLLGRPVLVVEDLPTLAEYIRTGDVLFPLDLDDEGAA